MKHNLTWQAGSVTAEDRAATHLGPGLSILMTGLSGSGKSTIAFALEAALVANGRASYVLDGDNLRHGLNHDLGFGASDRAENIRRLGEVARLMNEAGLVVIVPAIAPYRADRERIRRMHDDAGMAYVEVFVDAPLEVCEQRDPKGLYARARAGEVSGFTGIDDPYEVPEHPDLRIDTTELTVDEAVEAVQRLLDVG
ncbi:MAG: adenylyl-sulfate kinase [Acidimicrobiia bacterium]|nr:adenylyl-sulfate kinase [Acidimicrobiia bacterium]